MTTIVTRFAPSPTGMLHIGGARTALINALFAKKYGGKYLVRVEDTDRKRSRPEAIEAIREGLDWLGLSGDAEFVFQSARLQRHQEVAHKLLAEGKAYRCDCTPEDLQIMREQAKVAGRTRMYNRCCRDRDIDPAIPHVVRLKVPTSGVSEIHDLVQGTTCVEHDHLDDYILLRADGSPTYMLSCVVDDADMGITHIIRGDDHLNNAHRQQQFVHAAGFMQPHYAHIALLHGEDGAKLSKRHGALGISHYVGAGYLKEAVLNYLLRLGWGKGDEMISLCDAAEIFRLEDLSKSPSQVDFARLKNFNAHYLRIQSVHETDKLINILANYANLSLDTSMRETLRRALPALAERAETLEELLPQVKQYLSPVFWPLDEAKTQAQFLSKAPHAGLDKLLDDSNDWDFSHQELLNQAIQEHVKALDVGFGVVGQPLRIALCGSPKAPDIGAILYALGKQETQSRLKNAIDFLLRASSPKMPLHFGE